MPRYKRTFDEAELDIPLEPAVEAENVETLGKLRNMWEFASLMQYIYLFGHVVKIENDFDIEDLEAECVGPQPSEKLARIGLQLLKYVSSHRGLTPEIFDEYTRRQYVAKAPLRNPYGEEEEPAKFNDFDVFTKIRVLQQLSTWTLGNADRIRSMMPQEEDHLGWRIEPIGWDKEDRAYFVLDDDRLYRRIDEPVPPPTPKVKAKSKSPKKSKSKGTRSSKRRKIEETSEDEHDDVDPEEGAQDDTIMTNGEHVRQEIEPGFGFTNKTWECMAITLEEYTDFLSTIFRTRDPNEKQLRKMIEENVLPVIEKRAEAQRLKQMRKMREIENLQKLATAKRSSRLADKAEKEKQEREEREVEEKKQRDLKMAHDEQERQRRIEEGHESRRLTREQRVKEREVKRILHEEELTKLEEAANRASSQDPASDAATDANKRISERQLKTQKERHKKELEKMAEDEDNWTFDCAKCGVHGENLDDGTHSIACERCNVWQHSKCHGFSPKQAEKDGLHFVCATCKRKEADAKKPKIPPLKLSNKNKTSMIPEVQVPNRPTLMANGERPDSGALPDHIARQLDAPPQYYYPPGLTPGPFGPQITNGPSLSPYGQTQGPLGYRYPPVGNFAPPAPQQPWQGNPLPPPGRPPSSGYASSPAPSMANGYGSPNHHQQQHQYMHQNAVVSAGGHLGYRAPYQHQSPAYTYSRGAPGGMYPMASSPSQQHQQYYHSQTTYNSNQRPPYQQPPHQPQSGQLMNGAQSPVKTAPKPSNSPPQYDFHRQPQPPPQQQPHQGLARSPSTNFPPPTTNSYAQHGAVSPVKSSPPPNQSQQRASYNPRPPHAAPPQLAQSPQNFRPPYSNGVPPNSNYKTPQQQLHPSPAPAGANANGIAADGMSGPWPGPEGSKAIPQKKDNDQSPVPLAESTKGRGETKVVLPVAPPANYQNPQQSYPNLALASANANGIAADGMSGPWPEGSKAIPTKNDQSPAPPSSSQTVGETKILPPVAPLAPSPQSLQMHGTVPGESVGNVPVKKMPEVNTLPSRPDGEGVQASAATPQDLVEKAPQMNGPVIQPAAQVQTASAGMQSGADGQAKETFVQSALSGEQQQQQRQEATQTVP